MKPWSRATLEQYHQLNLRAHGILSDVPVLDVWQVSLPGKNRSCTMQDIRAIFYSAEKSQQAQGLVPTLFALRRFLGRLFNWDIAPPGKEQWSFRKRISAGDLQKSLIKPGTLDGPFEVLYLHPTEAISEIRNSTVHAFLVWAIEPTCDGHQLFWAIHALPVGFWTGPYLLLIRPFRHLIVYPHLLRQIHLMWSRNQKPESNIEK